MTEKPTIERIACFMKQSSYERYRSDKDRWENEFLQLPKRKQEAIKESDSNQKLFERSLERELAELDFDVSYLSYDDMKTTNGEEFDLYMSCGGDGMMLSLAQNFQESLLIGMNSDYSPDVSKGSIGALTSVNITNLTDRLERLAHGEFRVEEWRRIYAKHNGHLLPKLAVNEYHLGNEPYTISIEVEWKGKSEEYTGATGFIASGGMGSTAWWKNLGNTPFSKDLPIYGFSIREPNLNRLNMFNSYIIGDEVETNVVLHGGQYTLSADGKEVPVHLSVGDVLSFGLDKENPARVIRFPKKK